MKQRCLGIKNWNSLCHILAGFLSEPECLWSIISIDIKISLCVSNKYPLKETAENTDLLL